MKDIIVNGRQHKTDNSWLTYDDVALLAGLEPRWVPTVVYEHGRGDRSGSLTPGESVSVKDGMVFEAAVTNNT